MASDYSAQPQPPPSPPAPSCARPTFESIYKDYLKHVRTVVKRRVPPYDVDDVVQVIFAAIARWLPKVDPRLPFRPWLNIIVVRSLTAYSSREATRIMTKQGLAMMPRAEASSIDERLGALEMLAPALDCLDPRQQEIVIRHLGDDEPMDDVAKDMGLSQRGGYKLLEAAQARLDAFAKRHQAVERRLLGEQRPFLVPLGLGFHPPLWAAWARLSLGHALTPRA